MKSKLVNVIKWYRQLYINQSWNLSKKDLYLVRDIAEEYSIDPEILFGIMSLEKLNRGPVYRVAENICVYLFPWIVNRKDMSLGVGQVKVSTAKKLLGMKNSYKVMNILIRRKSNISVIAMFIKNHQDISELVSYYLFGRIITKPTREYYIYKELLTWSIKSEIFFKSLKRFNL